MAPAQLTIGLLWHSAASDNLGVGALTAAQISIIQDIAAAHAIPVRFVILGWRERRAPYITADNLKIFNLRTRDLANPRRLLSAVRDCDLILDIGAGDSFSDIYGARRFLKYMAAKATVHAAKRPLILAPQTIGPFRANWARRMAYASMARATEIFTRDQASINILRGDGFTAPLHLASDVALKLPFIAPPPRDGGGSIRVGLNVSGLLMNGGYTGRNMFELKVDYPALIERIIQYFVNREDCELHLVAHVLSEHLEVEDDWRAVQALASRTHGSTILAPRFNSPGEAKSYIAGLDFFMGARMHACIAALSAGVAVVPMAYSRKFAGLFGALGYDRTVDCTVDDEDIIMEQITTCFEARTVISQEASAARDLGLKRLAGYEDCVGEILVRAREGTHNPD